LLAFLDPVETPGLWVRTGKGYRDFCPLIE